MVRGRDCGDEERLTLDYRGPLLRLDGCDRSLDCLAFDNRSLLAITSYALCYFEVSMVST